MPRKVSNAQQYLDAALRKIESRALNRKDVKWSQVREHAQSMIEHAMKPSEAYPAITYVLSQLNDHHSFMKTRDGCAVPFPSDVKRTFDDRSPRPTLRKGTSGILRPDASPIGHVVVSGVIGDKYKLSSYAQNLQKQIKLCRAHGVNGWIIDLRGNKGGNMWPMLVGLGPLIGSGTLGFFVYGDIFIPWYYRQGLSGVVNARGECVNFALSNGMSDFVDQSPMAVLIDRNTVSSGEAVTISLQCRTRTRFFGERTAGLSTCNESIKLSDGAQLFLTTAVEADRNKRVYSNGIEPDVTIEQGKIACGAPNDPVIAAALQWIDSAH